MWLAKLNRDAPVKTGEAVQLTERRIKSAKPKDKPWLMWDKEVKGLGVRIGATKKSYIVYGRVRGKGKRPQITVGDVSAWSLEKARLEAKELLVKMGRGINPAEQTRQEEAGSFTLREAWELYLKRLINKKRSPVTIKGYEYMLNTYLPDWMDKSLTEQTPKRVHDRHQRIATNVEAGKYSKGRKRKDSKGTQTANNTFRVFGAIYNRALIQHPELPPNPCKNIDTFAVERRHTVIPRDKLPLWWADVHALTNTIKRDFLLMTLFTALRKTNVQEIQWEHVDWEAKTLLIPKTKAGKPFTLPLSDFLVELLERRKAENATLFPRSPFVFPGYGKSRHIANPNLRTVPEDASLEERLNKFRVPFMMHDLRRTFATVAEPIVSGMRLKKLLNHAPPKNDVTAGYVNPSTEDMRQPMQLVTDTLLECCNPPPVDKKVVRINKRREQA